MQEIRDHREHAVDAVVTATQQAAGTRPLTRVVSLWAPAVMMTMNPKHSPALKEEEEEKKEDLEEYQMVRDTEDASDVVVTAT